MIKVMRSIQYKDLRSFIIGLTRQTYRVGILIYVKIISYSLQYLTRSRLIISEVCFTILTDSILDIFV